MDGRSVKEASVEGVQRRMKPRKHFVFCIKVTWSDGTVNLVYRRYSRFLYLQTVLLHAFPSLGGPGSKRRSFVPLPDSLTSRMNIGDGIFRRMEQVNYFLKEILELESKVSQSVHVATFLTPTPEDLEPKHYPPVKGKRKRQNVSGKMKGRLQKFGRTVKPWGNKISSPIVMEHFIVMDDYNKQAKSDINLKKGRTVDVIEKRECGWWLVDSDGEVGWAPALYLEPADDMDDCSNVQKFPLGKGEVYETTKRYVAAEEDELSFNIGINLQILEKNYDGWWKALYLGKEGWVPAMYLRKLGNDRRKTGRRKSRMFSTTQLRDIDDIVEEAEPIPEETEEEVTSKVVTEKEDKKMSLPRTISHQLFFKMGEQKSKENYGESSKESEDGISNGDGTLKRSSREEKKTISSMIELSSPFVRLSEDKEFRGVSPKPSPRPQLQRRVISTIADIGHAGSAPREQVYGTRDDLSLKEKTQSLSALQSKSHTNIAVAKWMPETKNQFMSVPERNCKISAPVYLATDGQKTTNSVAPPEYSEGSLEEIRMLKTLTQIEDSDDSGSCELMQESTSSTEVDDGTSVDPTALFKSALMGRDSPRFAPPKRSPPSPVGMSTLPNNTDESENFKASLDEIDGGNQEASSEYASVGRESPQCKAPTKVAPVSPSISTWPRGISETEDSDDVKWEKLAYRRSTGSVGSIIRQQKIERETSEELNSEMNYWSSSEDSEPELGGMSFSKVLLPPPAIMADGSVLELPGEEDNFDEVGLNNNFISEGSLKRLYIERMMSKNECSKYEVYCTIERCEVDQDMTLDKGDCVSVLEKAPTGWWLVQNVEGLKGWAPSNYLYPAPEVAGDISCSLPESEGLSQLCSFEFTCYAIEEYSGDPDSQEITLRKGEIAHIVHKSESGWWCVRNEEGEIGWAPSNYLEELTDENDTVFS